MKQEITLPLDLRVAQHVITLLTGIRHSPNFDDFKMWVTSTFDVQESQLGNPDIINKIRDEVPENVVIEAIRMSSESDDALKKEIASFGNFLDNNRGCKACKMHGCGHF